MRRVGELLRQFMSERGWDAVNPYAPLFQGWDAIAGRALASHARLIDVQRGFLLVEVDHPGWLQVAQLRKAALLDGARKAAPHAQIEGLKLRVGAGPAGGQR